MRDLFDLLFPPMRVLDNIQCVGTTLLETVS